MMNELRWLIKEDGTKILQYLDDYDNWIDVKEINEKDLPQSSTSDWAKD